MYIEAGLPNVTGKYQVGSATGFWDGGSTSDSALYIDRKNYQSWIASYNGTPNGDLRLDLSRANSVYGNSNTVQPNSLTCCCYIKY